MLTVVGEQNGLKLIAKKALFTGGFLE